MSLIAGYRSKFNRVLGAYPYSEVIARLGGSQPNAPAMVAAAVSDLQTGSTVPRIPPVMQDPWSAQSVALPPRTRQEIHLAALPTEVSTSERLRSVARAPEHSRREGAEPSSQSQATDLYWVQLGVFRSADDAARLAERFRRDGATISRGWLTNAAGNLAGVGTLVRVGPLVNRSDALSKLRDLTVRGQEGFIAETRD